MMNIFLDKIEIMGNLLCQRFLRMAWHDKATISVSCQPVSSALRLKKLSKGKLT